MKIKQGMILTRGDEKVKVLGVCGEAVFLSSDSDFDKCLCTGWTEKEIITNGWKIPEGKWEPRVGEIVYMISGLGNIYSIYWSNNNNITECFLGVYPTKQAAKEALEEIKKKIQ